MQHDALQKLEEQLGVRPPEGLAALNESEVRALAEVIREALDQQSAALTTAIEGALARLPRPLRGPIRGILR